MKKVLLICTGNTCRSPMAEALLRGIAGRERLPIDVRSAGICAQAGADASEYAKRAVRELGFGRLEHKASPLTRELVDWADVILAMSAAHREYVIWRFPEAGAKTETLCGFCAEPGEILDPYGGSAAEYAACARRLAGLLETAAKRLG